MQLQNEMKEAEQQQLHQHQAKNLHKKHHQKSAHHHQKAPAQEEQSASENKKSQVGDFEIVTEKLTEEDVSDIQAGKHKKAVN